MEGKIEWVVKKFEDLSVYELYDLLQLRSEVFVVEQQCVFLDPDGIDLHCVHLLGYEGNVLVSCCRVVPPGKSYVSPSLGRIVVRDKGRKVGIGKKLVKKGIEVLLNMYDTKTIEIGAQVYLNEFYRSLGFKPVGEPYWEDGILHIHMIR
jgi:ElaA protein